MKGLKDWEQIYAEAKSEASRIAECAAATKGGPYIAAEKIMARRTTKGVHAAIVAALSVAVLCERGHSNIAEKLTKELALMADERL